MTMAFTDQKPREGVSVTASTSTTSSLPTCPGISRDVDNNDDEDNNNNNKNHKSSATRPRRLKTCNLIDGRQQVQQVSDYCKNNCHTSLLRQSQPQPANVQMLRGEYHSQSQSNNGTFVVVEEGNVSDSSATHHQSVSKRQPKTGVEYSSCDHPKQRPRNNKKNTKKSNEVVKYSDPSSSAVSLSSLVTLRTPSEVDQHQQRLPQEVVDQTYEELELSLSPPPTPKTRHLFEDHIYENLTYIENCYRRLLPIRNTPPTPQEEDNIYENICDKCDQIFSGELCKNCAKHKSNNSVTSERKKRSFSDFFNSLKRRQKAEKKTPRASAVARKIEIVHNVDGFATTPFKANQTFDLQEICALRLVHQQQLQEQKQLLSTFKKEEEKEEVILRRKRGSGDPEVKDGESRECHRNKKKIHEEEDEDDFITTDLNLNSLRSAYETLVESLAVTTSPDGRFGAEVELELECVDCCSTTITNHLVAPKAGNSSGTLTELIDSPELNIPSTTSVTIDDETITPSPPHPVAVEVEATLTTPTTTENPLISQPLENKLCLSVRQWMTSLLYETNDDDEPVVESLVGGGDLNWYFVKHVPSRTFEERNAFYSGRPNRSSSSLVRGSKESNNYKRSSSSCESDLNVRIDCFKSEVSKNLEQRLAAVDQGKGGADDSIIITVKEEICYQEEQLSISSDFDNEPIDNPPVVELVTHVEKSTTATAPPSDIGAVLKKCNTSSLVLETNAVQNENKIAAAKVSLLSSTTGCRVGVCNWNCRRRRNAITESRRHSLKFQLITRQLLSAGVQNRVFCVAASFREQLVVLKGVLRVNRHLLRGHRGQLEVIRRNYQRGTWTTINELIMGVLSLVDSLKEAEKMNIIVGGATEDRPINGQNNLDGVAVRRQLQSYNIDQRVRNAGDWKRISEEGGNTEEDCEATTTAEKVPESEEESIYQPIWKFHTVGIGRENTSSDTFDGSYNTNDFAEIGDTVEWEIAEEFEFGSSRETLLDSPSAASSMSSSSTATAAAAGGDQQSKTAASSSTTIEIEDEEEKSGSGDYAKDHEQPKWRFSYSPVCILYDLRSAANNMIIYNYDGNPTRRLICSCAGGGGGLRNKRIGGDKATPLSGVCESEKLLAAERNGPLSSVCKHKSRVVGYEDDEAAAAAKTTQCNNNCYAAGGTTKRRCDVGGVTVGSSNREEATHEKVMPPKVYLIPDSVAAWKFMLLDAHYAEDEEDVIMSVPNLLDIHYDAPVMLETKKLPPLQVPSKESKSQKTNLLNPRKYVMSGRLNIEEQKTNYLHKSIVGSYKQIEFGSVDNLNFLSKSKSTSSIISSSSPTKKSPRFLRFRPNSPRDDAAAKLEKQRTVVFGSDLNTLKLDPDTSVPKFVVECIRLIQQPESIQTNGVYRASGNKNSIEMVKKRMNDRLNLRKDTIWQFLEKQDVHTLTGSLKLFFRGLSTQLIPDFLFDQLPDHLGDESSLECIRIIIEELEELPRVTLKFLIKHLTVVTENQAENLMNSSNLSICWGACLFASSATAFDSFESGNIIRKNHFVKVLIEHYHQIFEK